MNNRERLIIIGAGGHGKVVADIAEQVVYSSIVFLDSGRKTEWASHPVLGEEKKVQELEGDVIVAIGNAKVRRKIQESVDERRLATLIHPSAVVASITSDN